jgi:uncharacterized protein (DUF427 family)
MNTRNMKLPGPDHPITIEPGHAQLIVIVGAIEILNSSNALLLREAKYPPVFYVPRRDVDMSRLTRTLHATYCPYKGDCSYYSIPIGGAKSTNAVWTYERPYAAVAAIQGHLAFYPDRVDRFEINPDLPASRGAAT